MLSQDNSFLGGARVLITGGTGFLGREVVIRLANKGATVETVSRRTGVDLRNAAETLATFVSFRPDVIIHLAAKVGGIIANMNSPGSFFYENMLMGMNVVHAAHLCKARTLMVGTVCSYPKDCPVPFKEETLWEGYPEPTNAPYGIAKKALLVMLQAYRKEYDLRFGYLVPTNLYGPGDNFNDNSSHVIPALIKRLFNAKQVRRSQVECLGTGRVTRSFLHVCDAADAIAAAAANLDDNEPINLPGGPEITMAGLTTLVARLIGYEGEVRWDISKPDGQPRRLVDGTRAKRLLGWAPSRSLEEGLKSTINWYLQTRGMTIV